MGDATAAFFRRLEEAGHQPLLGRVRGSLRFDLEQGKRIARWHVSVDRGEVSVSRRNLPADCVVRADRALFEQIVSGEQNAMAAVLRGTLRVDGRPRLLVQFQRLLPGPATSKRVSAAGWARRHE